MKDLTPKQRNIDYTYEVAYRNLAKVATKEIIRAGGYKGVVNLGFMVDNKNIQSIEVKGTDILVMVDGNPVMWCDIPDTKKIEIYNHISLNRILR